MKSQSLIPSRMALVLGCGLALASSALTVCAKADQWDKKTILTVNEPVQVRETLLQPGTYVMKLYNSNSERHVVQIFNADQSHIISTVLAIPRERLEPTGDTAFTFWETPPGTARAMRTWFYPGDNFGQEFPYPKHLTQIAMASTTSVTPMPAPAVTETAPAETPAQTETQSEIAANNEPYAEQPVETAEAPAPAPTPTPAPMEPEPQPAPAPQQPTELPKTSTLYPLIGLSGALLIGLSGLLRLKRTS